MADQGPFLNFLDWVNTAGEVPLNVLRGRPGAALRKGADFLLDIPDAFIPFADVIPQISNEEDSVTASEALGIDPYQSPKTAKIADIVGGTLVNPLTYVGLGGGKVKAQVPFGPSQELSTFNKAIQSAKQNAGMAYKKYVPEGARKSIGKSNQVTGDFIRRTLNYLDTPKEGEDILSLAQGTGQQVSDTARRNIERIYEGVTPSESSAIAQILQRIDRTGGDRQNWKVIDDIDAYLAARGDVRPDVVKRVIEERAPAMKTMWEEGSMGGVGGNIFVPEFVHHSGGKITTQGLKSQYNKDLANKLIPEDATFDEYASLRGFTQQPSSVSKYVSQSGAKISANDLRKQYDLDLSEGQIAGGTTIDEYALSRGLKPLPADQAIDAYLRGEFSGFQDIADPRFRSGSSGVLKEKALTDDPNKLLSFLQQKPEIDLADDAMGIDLRRAATQGRLAQKADIGKRLLGKENFALANPEDKAAVLKKIDEIEQSGQRDYAYQLRNAFNGIEQRSENWFAKGLHSANKAFKGAATFGVIFPRVAFNFGNRVSGTVGQIISNPEARKTILESAKRMPSDLAGAHKDGVIALNKALSQFDNDFIKAAAGVLPKETAKRTTELSSDLAFYQQAIKDSQGSVKKLREILSERPDLQKAVDYGVMDNFVNTEELLARMASNTTWTKIKDVMKWPAAIAQGVEQRMRYGTFKDLLKERLPPGDAARTVKETYLDYKVPGIENRIFRDIVPFGAFLTQNVKQQAKFLAEQPSVAVASGQLLGTDNENDLPKYPWLDQQFAVPIGVDETGNAKYISSFRHPIEGLTQIPGGSSSDIYSDIVGNLQPLLKTGISYAANKDPLTGMPFGQYDKVLGETRGEYGRAYNAIAGTGLIQALATPINQAGALMDERKSAIEKSLQFLTGIRTTSVDPDLAKRQRIEEFLQENPDIRTSTNYFNTGENEDMNALLKELREAKDRLRLKREAQAAL
jgi:hypothetical protein